jgi:hypothetical protein
MKFKNEKLFFFQVKMSVEIEVFIECEDNEYAGMYAVSDRGNVINLRTKKMLKPHIDTQGYLRVNFNGHNKMTIRLVHRLMAKAWIENPKNLPIVDHIDRNKQNNTLSNLRWVSHQENVLNSDAVEFSKKYSISYYRTLPKPSKWAVTWRQDDIIKNRFFLTEEEARKFARENLEGKPFLQTIHKPRV